MRTDGTNDNEKSLGNKVHRLRTEANKTLEDVARAGGLAPSMVYRIEAGVVRRPHEETLKKLARGLGVSLESLLRTKERQERHERWRTNKGSDESFGNKLGYYRDARLGMTQTEFADKLSASKLYQITPENIADWEANRHLEQIDRSLYTLIESTLVEEAEARSWSKTEILAMQKDMREAYANRLQHQNDTTDNPFSQKLRHYREKLGMTQQDLAEAIIEDSVTRNHIVSIENDGAPPSLRFILASADYFHDPDEGRLPAVNDLEKGEYIALGIQQRNEGLSRGHR